MVVAEYLFNNVALQVERLNRYISSMQAALKQTPEVLNSVSVDIASMGVAAML